MKGKNMSIKDLVDRIIADGKITINEHEELLNAVHANGKIDEEENEQITRIINMINRGELKLK